MTESFRSSKEVNEEMVRSSKLDRNKSIFAQNKSKLQESQNFEKISDQKINDTESVKEQAAKLSSEFWGYILDTTVPSQKGPIVQNLEKDFPKKLANLIIKLEEDEALPPGYGPASGIVLLCKAVLHLRDSNADLSRKVYLLEQKVSSLTKETK